MGGVKLYLYGVNRLPETIKVDQGVTKRSIKETVNDILNNRKGASQSKAKTSDWGQLVGKSVGV